MQASEVPRAVAAAMSSAEALDLTVDDAMVLNDSNRLVLRLLMIKPLGKGLGTIRLCALDHFPGHRPANHQAHDHVAAEVQPGPGPRLTRLIY
jgi:hypothetical protein